MVFIPSWTSNILLLLTCWLSGYQLVKRGRPNPVATIQFFMVVFSLLMVLLVVFYNNKGNPWLSLVFLLIAVGSLGVMIRQHRMLPTQSFE